MSDIFSEKKLTPIVLIAGMLLAPFWSEAAVVTLYPTDDAHVDAALPTTNYGAEFTLDVGVDGPEDSPKTRRTYLIFDLSTMPLAVSINSAYLYMNVSTHSSNSPFTKVAVHDVTYAAWNEMAITWDSQPNTPPLYNPIATATTAVTGPGACSWDVTNDVAAAHGVGIPYSAMLKVENENYVLNEPNFIQFDSRDTSTTPYLVIDYNPPLNLPPNLNGMVTSVRCWNDPIFMFYDQFGDPDGDDEDDSITRPLQAMRIHIKRVLDDDDPIQILAIDPNRASEFVGFFDFDPFGRLKSCSTNPAGSDTNRPTEMEFDYDFRGNLINAKTRHSDKGQSSWSFAYDSNDALFRRVLDRTDIARITTAQVDYFPHNPAGLLSKLIQGASGDATSYSYDPLSRLVEITGVPDITMRRYQYNPEGMLSQYQNFENPDLNCTYGYSYDPLNTLPTRIASSTFSPNPAHARFGQLELSYHSNATIKEVRYSSAESGPTLPLFTTLYAYDNLGRILRIRCISHEPDVPSIIVTIDPDLPEGNFMLSNYFYDRLGRLAWTVYSRGYITRTIYHQAPGLRSKAMLDLHIEEPNRPAFTSYEYDHSPAPLRTSDLKGHFTKYEYDSLGNRISSCVLGVHGAEGAGGNAQGQVFRMSANDGLAPDSPLRVESDQYGNFRAVLRVIDVPPPGEKEYFPPGPGKKTRTTLSRNKKKLRNRPAWEIRRGCSELLKGDCNGDCQVNFFDVACLAHDWLVDKSEEH
ncbi:MAG: DNRLRE domain-containing protein [Planctomycetota bacterium]|jgi:YD repeat-containing protein